MQLADELPMIYTVCIMAFATFSYRRPAKVQALIAAALVGLAVFITVRAQPRCVFLFGGGGD
jgi:dihydroceramidase